MEEFETLYTSLKQWNPTISRDDANNYIAKNVSILSEEGRETFFKMVELYCKDFGVENTWLIYLETLEDGYVYRCDPEMLPDQLAFILFKFVQKTVEMHLSV
jgi:hypothetical protein